MTDDDWKELEETLPPVIARSEVPKLLGGLISAGRLANLDSEGNGPPRLKPGRKVGYPRHGLIEWLRNREKYGRA